MKILVDAVSLKSIDVENLIASIDICRTIDILREIWMSEIINAKLCQYLKISFVFEPKILTVIL